MFQSSPFDRKRVLWIYKHIFFSPTSFPFPPLFRIRSVVSKYFWFHGYLLLSLVFCSVPLLFLLALLNRLSVCCCLLAMLLLYCYYRSIARYSSMHTYTHTYISLHSRVTRSAQTANIKAKRNKKKYKIKIHINKKLFIVALQVRSRAKLTWQV